MRFVLYVTVGSDNMNATVVGKFRCLNDALFCIHSLTTDEDVAFHAIDTESPNRYIYNDKTGQFY